MKMTSHSLLLNNQTNFKKLISDVTDELFLMGIIPSIGAEIEFYLNGPVEKFCAAAKANGLKIEKERGENQLEIIIEHSIKSLNFADLISETKNRLETLAAQLDCQITFAAKPLPNDYGSALHYHISLHNENGDNLFAESIIADNALLQQSIAGIMNACREGLVLLCEFEEDYNRFIANKMAPTHFAWGVNNRTTVIRIPHSTISNRRIEFRLAPANACPYKTQYLLLLGILHGIKNSMQPPPITWGNAHDEQYQLDRIPICLKEAKAIFLSSKMFNHIK